MSASSPVFHADAPVAPRLSRRAWLNAIIGLIILLAFWTMVVAVSVAFAASSALQGKQKLTDAQAAAVQLDFPSVQSDLTQASASFASAEHTLFVARSMSFVPWVGTQISAADAGLMAGEQTLTALNQLTDLGAQLIQLSGLSVSDLANVTNGVSGHATFQDLSPQVKDALLRRLAAAAPELEQTSAQVDVARADLAALPQDEMAGPVASALRPMDEKLASLQTDLHLASVAAQLLPAFGGLNGTSTTLLLFLNNAELRPGGGFVGSFGLLSMKDGSIASLDSADSYSLDLPVASQITTVPPAPLRNYLGVSQWFFRDGNWSPDFAVSAAQELTFYRAETSLLPAAARVGAFSGGTPSMNVVGLTPTFVSSILNITGPVTVGGQTYAADNVADLLQEQVDETYVQQGLTTAQRKTALIALVSQTEQRLASLPFASWPPILSALEESITDKQTAFYSEDATTQNAIVKAGWGGHLAAPTNGADALMVVDANLGALKSDPAIQRSISYSLHQNTAHQLVATTTIQYVHTGAFDWRTTRYRSYVRLYVPLGSQLVSTTGSLANDKLTDPTGAPGVTDVSTDLGFTTFGAFIAVEPGETRNLTFQYILPDAVAQALTAGTYQLAIFKQLGADPRALTLQLDFGKNLVSADPPEARQNWGDQSYTLQATLDQDQTFNVNF